MKIVKMRLYKGGGESDMVDLTGADMRKLLQCAYDLSKPLGTETLHYRLGVLTDEEADDILASYGPSDDIHLDYLGGRSLKLHIFRVREWDGDAGDVEMFMPLTWMDHTERDVERLVESCTAVAKSDVASGAEQ